MDFDFPSTDAATLPHDGNDVLLIQQNHAYWQPIIGLQLPIVAVATLFVRFTFWMNKKGASGKCTSTASQRSTSMRSYTSAVTQVVRLVER
jgi:hypothetical protein